MITCDACGEGPRGGDEKMLRCSRCKAVWYHDRKCQRKAWKNHKEVCQKPPLQWTGGKRFDPAKVLGSDLMIRVFSFLISGGSSSGEGQGKEKGVDQQKKETDNEQPYRMYKLSNDEKSICRYIPQPTPGTIPLEVVAKLYASLAQVSRDWKSIMDGSMDELVDSVLVDLSSADDHHSQERKEQALAWLCDQHPKLKINSIYNADTQASSALPWIHMLQKCNTIGLVEANINMHCFMSNNEDAYRSNNDKDCCEQVNFQRTLRRECPNLKKLQFALCVLGRPSTSHAAKDNLWFQAQDETGGFLCYELFSHPTIEKLCIFLLQFPEPDMLSYLNGCFYNKLIENLPNLKELVLETDPWRETSFVVEDQPLLICSESLESLVIDQFAPKPFLRTKFSLDCPKLKIVRLSGYLTDHHGNVIENPSAETGVQEGPVGLHQLVVKSRRVPDSCQCVIRMRSIGVDSKGLLQDIAVETVEEE